MDFNPKRQRKSRVDSNGQTLICNPSSSSSSSRGFTFTGRKEIPSDRLSDLPPDIISNILSQLPIRDAVATCVLSRQWRYKWCSMNRLVFEDDYLCLNFYDDDDDDDDTPFTRVINSVLRLHHGPVQEFVVSGRNNPHFSDINQWGSFLSFLSRNGIKELSLRFGLNFMVPSSIFQCSKLTRLELTGCEMLELPVDFEGFVSLKTLVFGMVHISDDSLEKLLSGCPLLESLELCETVRGLLKVNAPRLKFLLLAGLQKGFFLEKTPLLEELSVDFRPGLYVDDRVVIKFFSRIPSLQKLVGISLFMKYWSADNDPASFSSSHDNLQFIKLNMNFNDTSQMLLLLQLIDCSTSLKELEISDFSQEGWFDEPFSPEWWSEAHQRQRDSTQLKKVVMMMSSDSPNKTEFMRLLLLRSPALETMNVYVQKSGKNALAKLLKCPAASAWAKIVYNHNEFRARTDKKQKGISCTSI